MSYGRGSRPQDSRPAGMFAASMIDELDRPAGFAP
jgi:hypothetical protein